MECPRCGHENQPGSRFCSQCGNQLETVCPVCSAVAAPDARFCSNCGNALGTEPAPSRAGDDVARHVPPELLSKITEARDAQSMQGERRTVTMLFADIQGSTAAAEGFDPEDWSDIINGAFEYLIAPVYRYEGTLARLLGDAVLAFFGAPIAHEDDPVRAVRAGLDIVEGMRGYRARMVERWGFPIDVRVGINTGLVVVGEVGSDLRVEYTALGDAVNVAARMEQTAEPGTVRITRETWGLVAEHFDGEPIGPVAVKGKSEPVEAVRVLAVRAPAEGTDSPRPLVGRSAELAALEGLGSRLMAGTGWIASIIGEAGVGKSRLLDEFHRRTTGARSSAAAGPEPGEPAWAAAYSESYDTAVPYSTIRDLLVRWWRLEGADDPYRLVEEMRERALPGQADVSVYLGYIAGVPLPAASTAFLDRLETPTLHRRVRRAVADYLAAEASHRPLVVALEDIHWADPMSLTLIEDLMQLSEQSPVGVVFSMRPYRDEPTWHVHEVAQRDHPHRYHSVELATLDLDATERLLDAHLEGLAVSEEMRRRILDRSDGNPLFIEQMVRAMQEGDGGVEETPVPTGLASLLTARLDRLEPESRMVAQIASVVGSEFDRGVLAAVVGDQVDLDARLTDLLRREIFTEKSDAAPMLAFHHALMCDAAYSTMLLRTRRRLHGRVARHLAATDPDSSQEIARHFMEAREPDEAFPHLVAAGTRSARSMALADAIRFFTGALERIPAAADPELVVAAHDGLGVAYSLVPDLTQSEAAYQRLVDYADTAGQPSAKVTALNRLAMATATIGGDLAGARRYLDDACVLAQEVGDELGLAEYHMNSCVIAGLSGDVDAAVRHDEETIRAGESLGTMGIRNEGMVRLATNAVWLMDFDRAVPAVEDAMEAARETGDELNLATLDAMVLSRLRLREGDTEAALRLLESGAEILGRYAFFYTPLVRTLIGQLLSARGEVESAVSLLAEVRRAAVEDRMRFFEAISSSALAEIYASVGLAGSVGEMRESAERAVTAPVGGYLASTVWADLAGAALALGDLEEADADVARGLETPSASQYWEKPRLLITRAILHVRSGRPEEAHRVLDEVQTFVLEKAVRTFDAQVGHARGLAFLAQGEPREASVLLEEAVRVASASGYRPLAVEIRAAAASAALAGGDPKVAADHVAWARAEVEAMAGGVVDDELRAALRARWLAPLEQIVTG